MDEQSEQSEQSPSMNLERFTALVQAYGADFDRWPEQQRPAAEQLVAGSPQAQAVIEREAALDELLALAPASEPSARLRRVVLAAAPVAKRSWAARLDSWTRSLWPFGPRWQPASALVLAAVLGLVMGTTVLQQAASTSQTQELTELAFGPDEDWSETP